MSYILESTFQKITLVKISSILWNQSDIRELIDNFNCMNFLLCVNTERKEWKKIEEKVIKKVQKLPLPKRLKEKISGFVRPMGWQILKWIEYHCISQCAQRCYLTLHMPTEFSWTPWGTIDRKETAKILISDPAVDIATRYKLAYMYCLEDEIQKVWDTMPRDCIEAVYTEEENPGVISEEDLVFFWTGINKPQSIRFDTGASSLENAFRNAAESGSKAAAEYFLNKLTPRKREVHLVQAGQGIPDVEVLCFLLSEMDEEQRMRVFKSNPHSVMLKLFDWPWMNFYVETANRMWDSLSKYDNCFCFTPLTALIISYVNNGYEDGIYQKLFKELWQYACERYATDVCASPNLLSSLFYVKDKENIQMIFREASPAIKRDFILSGTGFGIGQQLMKDNEWDLLKFFIHECLSSKREITEYKKRLKEYAASSRAKHKYDINALIDEFFLLFR